ncbi:hypothetical protein DHEL01_v204907 [Diaporthe helianthi]|uniref:Uncharacterized protein n=1 Tax=Diaporthe helianthi TaxID=158607 RepID=A0A2P5I2G2_DIAHE|nr:hypothetical protein DHEL01_v204907 [Diaporthe helianthi]
MESTANTRLPFSELPKSPPMGIRVESSLAHSHTLPETRKYIEAVSHRVSADELPLLRSEIKQTTARIYDNWGLLEHIVQRHEALIQKRWSKKSIAKRRELLLAAWPNMARDRRPDIALTNRATALAAKLLQQGWKKLLQLKQYEGSQREALLMPYMNLHNLTKTEPLLLMINARARQPPDVFSGRDIQFSTIRFDLTKWLDLSGYVMDLNGTQSFPESYGELRQAPKEVSKVIFSADSRLTLVGGVVSVGDGLWALEIQDRVYSFLLQMAQKILHDIPYGDLTGTKYSIQAEPPLPSANFPEDGVVTLANTNLEAIYSSPAQMDLDRLQSLLTAMASEAEDKLWALREDPGRFSEDMEDIRAHRSEYVLDLFGKQHSSITTGVCCGSDIRSLDNLLSTECLRWSCAKVEYWCGLVRDITALVEIKAQHFDNRDMQPGAPLPEPFALALCKLHFALSSVVQRRLLCLRNVVYSSPPLRPYVRRASSETLDGFIIKVKEKSPRHIAEFVRILGFLFFEQATKLSGCIGCVQLLLEEYDVFINTVPDAQQAVSSFVAEEISHITLLSECLRQINLFQPFKGASNTVLSMKGIRDVFMAHVDEKRQESAALLDFVPSAETQSIAVALTKIPYPVQKKPSAANVQAMQHAEMLLDQMWDAWLAEIEPRTGLPAQVKKVLFQQGRQLQRTPAWVQPEPVEFNNMARPQPPFPEALVQPFGGIAIDDNTKAPVRPVEKAKVKTRGTAVPRNLTMDEFQTAEPEGPSPVQTIQVDRRAIKVFSALFHIPSSTSQPGEVPWNDFLHAMRSAGFWMEKLYGSVWQFSPRRGNDNNSNNIHMGVDMRTILFHEPHPHSRIPFRQARRHGRRLARAYGWSGQTFVLKH